MQEKEVDKLHDDTVAEVPADDNVAATTDTGPVVEPKFVKECKMCNFSKTHPDFYNFLVKHAMEGAAHNKLKNLADKYVQEHGLKFKVPVRKSIGRHFTKHMPVREMVAMEAAKAKYIPVKGKPLVESHVFENFKVEDFDEYEELCRLFTKFKEVTAKIYEYDSSLQVGHPSGGEVWSQNKIQTWTSMMNTQKSILSEIAKMRQGDKLIAIAAKYVIKTFTENIIAKLKQDFQSFVLVMRRQNVDEDVISTFEDLTTTTMVRHFVEEAESTMGKAKKQFKLPSNVHH